MRYRSCALRRRFSIRSFTVLCHHAVLRLIRVVRRIRRIGRTSPPPCRRRRIRAFARGGCPDFESCRGAGHRRCRPSRQRSPRRWRTAAILLTAHFNTVLGANVSAMFRVAIAEDLKIPVSNVLIFASHNHTDLLLASNQVAHSSYCIAVVKGLPEATSSGGARCLPGYAAARLPRCCSRDGMVGRGTEGRITTPQGRRADGSTYFMREEDRESWALTSTETSTDRRPSSCSGTPAARGRRAGAVHRPPRQHSIRRSR